jgi:AcrR family transcriptional regulator
MVCRMSEKLSVKDWVNAALKALAKHGFIAVKADTLAKILNVSRGSFYWHFENIETFHLAVMQSWQDVATNAIIAQVEATAKADDRLPLLARLAFTADSSLEIAMRAWGQSYPPAQPFIEAVDKTRLNYIKKLLTESGLPATLAQTRACIIYWTYLGSALAGAPLKGAALKNLTDQLVLLARQK